MTLTEVLASLARGAGRSAVNLPADVATLLSFTPGINQQSVQGVADAYTKNVTDRVLPPSGDLAETAGEFLGPPTKTAGKGATLLAALGTKHLSRPEIAQILKRARKEGGGTVPLSGADRPTRGYAVATTKQGLQTTFPADGVKTKDVERFMREQGMGKEDNLGLWVNPDDGLLYLDKSKVRDSKFRAVNEGNANKQLAVWDLKRFENVDTPFGVAERKRQELAAPTPFSVITPKPTVKGDAAFPGIYDNPQKIVHDSGKMVVDENPLLRELFGVDRAGLDAMAYQRMDFGNASPLVHQPTRPPEYLDKVTTKKNAQRLQDVIGLTADDPKFTGMAGWYMTEPMLNRPLELLGPTEGAKFFREHHLYASPMSAMNDVAGEIKKGSFAHLLAGQGRLDEFFDTKTLPYGMNHPAHTTAHAAGVKNMQRTGGDRFWQDKNTSQKTPVYFHTKTGENSFWPTSDAHFVRATGLPDVRPKILDKDTGERIVDASSIGKTEMAPLGEWFNKDVTSPLGLTGGVGQPILWGGMASRTGVESAIGAPYLELLTNQIEKSAKRQGITPQEAWDNYILGASGKKSIDPYKGYLGMLLGGAVGAGALMGSEEQ
jgi:hypothetical protein